MYMSACHNTQMLELIKPLGFGQHNKKSMQVFLLLVFFPSQKKAASLSTKIFY